MLVTAALVAGGASAAAPAANAALQLAALAVIAGLLIARATPRPAPLGRSLLILLAAGAALMLVQLVPLPPGWWTRLPGRDQVANGFVLMGRPPPWLPISLTPDRTVASLLSLLVPTAVLLATQAAGPRGRRWAIACVIAVALASLVLGAIQLAGGPDGGAYLYAITNNGSATGLFANRNHLASLLLVAIPLAAALGRAGHAPRRPVLRRSASGGAVTLLALGVAAVGSRAGWALLPPTLAGALWVAAAGGRSGRKASTLAVLIVVIALGLGASTLWATSERAIDSDPQHRASLFATTAHAAGRYWPIGSGAGSFTTVFPAFEDPARASPEYANHAHDDYAELALEAGAPGLALAGAALVLLGIAAARAARPETRAGVVATAVLLAHGGVDYPLRTAALAAVAALAAALAAAPPPPPEAPRTPRAGPARHPPTLLEL